MTNKNYPIFLMLFLVIFFNGYGDSEGINFDIGPGNIFEYDDPEPITNLIVENDEIICEYCYRFSMVVEAYENQIWQVNGFYKIHFHPHDSPSSDI